MEVTIIQITPDKDVVVEVGDWCNRTRAKPVAVVQDEPKLSLVVATGARRRLLHAKAGEMQQQQQQTGTVSGNGAGVGELKAIAQIGKDNIFHASTSTLTVDKFIHCFDRNVDLIADVSAQFSESINETARLWTLAVASLIATTIGSWTGIAFSIYHKEAFQKWPVWGQFALVPVSMILGNMVIWFAIWMGKFPQPRQRTNLRRRRRRPRRSNYGDQVPRPINSTETEGGEVTYKR